LPGRSLTWGLSSRTRTLLVKQERRYERPDVWTDARRTRLHHTCPRETPHHQRFTHTRPHVHGDHLTPLRFTHPHARGDRPRPPPLPAHHAETTYARSVSRTRGPSMLAPASHTFSMRSHPHLWKRATDSGHLIQEYTLET
jgi:hypothetical protein